MADKNSLLAEVLVGMVETTKNCGFTVLLPHGVSKTELPLFELNGRSVLEFRGENKALRVEQFDDKIYLMCARREGGQEEEREFADADFSQLLVSLFDSATMESKDARYIANEFSEAVEDYFGANAKKEKKLPQTVSKAAAKSGALSYDANTLANRLSVMYPELREPYKQNVQQYGDFLPEEFFQKYGNKPILETIRGNDAQKMRKLFNLLNEIYEDGTNEIQSIIAVTVLSELQNDQELLANCVDYMCADMITPVVQVNKYLHSPSGKGARMRMATPPKYKPKKEKKKSGLLSSLGLQ